MNAWLQRWKALAPREQWLALGCALVLLCMAYLLLIGDPLKQRHRHLSAQLQTAQVRLLDAQNARTELQARREHDPDLSLRSSLLLSRAEQERLLAGIEQETSGLVTPLIMRRVLEDLLRAQPGLVVQAAQSFSEPLRLADQRGEPAAAVEVPVSLYRHGVRLTLEGGYFDLLRYLQAIQGSGWRLHWQHLDYQVGAAGATRASIRLELYTLSRQAGWVGV